MTVPQHKVLIMAAGTGGHIFPALSIAKKLQTMGVSTEWLGATNSMEAKILAGTDIPLHTISIKGLRGKGVLRLLMAPFMILSASFQAVKIIRKVKPSCVLGMGGFVCGPGGIAAKLTGKKLLLHEQNAVAGLTNKILAVVANRVMEAFPGTFEKRPKIIYTGNPVRDEIAAINKSYDELLKGKQALKILVLGGSQGAVAVNAVIPELLKLWHEAAENVPHIVHQVGERNYDQAKAEYSKVNVELNEHCVLTPFIDDMAESYNWADLVICRSGASTVSEIAAAGIASILIPYPHHADMQQLKNAQWLADSDAALIVEQHLLTANSLFDTLRELDASREKISQMASLAKTKSMPNACAVIAQQCLEVANA